MLKFIEILVFTVSWNQIQIYIGFRRHMVDKIKLVDFILFLHWYSFDLCDVFNF